MIIDVKKQVTSNLPIAPVKLPDGNYKYNGLNPVKLVGVEVGEQTYSKGEFAGRTLKVLKFQFQGLHVPTEPDSYLTHTEKIIGSVEGEAMTPRLVADVEGNIVEMWNRIKHILDGCAKSPHYRDISNISEKDIKKYLDLPAEGDIETRVAKFNQFFEFVASFVNGDGKEVKSMLTNDKGEYVVTGWLKLVPNHPSRKFYVIPTWVQTGFFEPALFANVQLQTLAPAKIIRVGANENLELSKAKAASDPTGGAPAGAQGGANVSPDVLNFLGQQ